MKVKVLFWFADSVLGEKSLQILESRAFLTNCGLSSLTRVSSNRFWPKFDNSIFFLSHGICSLSHLFLKSYCHSVSKSICPEVVEFVHFAISPPFYEFISQLYASLSYSAICHPPLASALPPQCSNPHLVWVPQYGYLYCFTFDIEAEKAKLVYSMSRYKVTTIYG